jgi:hypothetical protein
MGDIHRFSPKLVFPGHRFHQLNKVFRDLSVVLAMNLNSAVPSTTDENGEARRKLQASEFFRRYWSDQFLPVNGGSLPGL